MDRKILTREILGWGAVCTSTLVACFWAYWGINENFHEGWFSTSIWLNIGLMLVQYLSPMLVVLMISILALRWYRAALPLVLTVAVAIAWVFRRLEAGVLLIAIPLVAIGVLYYFGRPQPRRWAWRILIGLPLVTLIACGVTPWWLAIHRVDDGNYGMRRVEGNGVTLIWAPEGPGWPSLGATWYAAGRTCTYLTIDGKSLSVTPQNIWRLPTIDEAVRSLVIRGGNAGGVWDPLRHRALYRTEPDKDSPLWKVHSQVIYWWTSTEVDQNHAYYISNNGFVISVPKRIAPGYLAFRCVCEPSKLNALGATHE